MSEEGRFTLHLEQLEGYEFKVRFDWDQVPELIVDEPPPLGHRAGPNPSRLLAVAAANCLSASLLFCVTKNEPPAGAVKTAVTCRMVRNEKQRLRVGGMTVRIEVDEALADAVRFKRCLDLFEDFCVVTASIRDGIPVAVEVCDPAGNVLHSSG
jgi:organic hydroperoxide reductase OsmC/OhrA